MGKEQDEFRFFYKFQAGQEWAYRISVNGRIRVSSNQEDRINPIHIEMEIEQRVLEISEEKAKVAVFIKKARNFSGSDSAPLPEEGQKSIMTVDSQGNTEYLSGTGGWKGSEFSQLIFPKRKLYPGLSWIQETVANVGPQTFSKSKFTFRGFEKSGSFNCAVFESELDVNSPDNPFQKGPGSTTGKIFFSQDLGQVVKTIADTNFSFVIPVGQTGGVQATTTTTLQVVMRLIEKR